MFSRHNGLAKISESSESNLILSICGDKLISTPIIIILLPVLPLGCEKIPFLSNPIPYLEYLYLSISAFLANLTAPKQTNFQCWITVYIIIFAYLINSVNVYYISMIIHNFILL